MQKRRLLQRDMDTIRFQKVHLQGYIVFEHLDIRS